MLRPRILFLTIALCATPQTTHAAVTTYTTQASFLADVQAGYYLETFNSLPFPAQVLGTSQNFSGNGFSYSASAPGLGLYSAGSMGDVWLSTDTNTASITFNFTTPITAVGGNFFTSDISGLFAAGDITLQLADGSFIPPEVLVGTTTSTFFGFISTQTITSLIVTANQNGPIWPTVNDFIVGNAGDPDGGGGSGGDGSSTVPEPTTIAVFGMMGVAGLVARRRKLARA